MKESWEDEEVIRQIAETYDQDLDMLNYRAPQLAVDFLDANFPGAREEVQVLDVACGSGLVGKLMAELGFRHFVGVDCSQGMLDQAAKTGLYQDLRLALLGSDPLPAQTGVFDVVMLVGGAGCWFCTGQRCSGALPRRQARRARVHDARRPPRVSIRALREGPAERAAADGGRGAVEASGTQTHPQIHAGPLPERGGCPGPAARGALPQRDRLPLPEVHPIIQSSMSAYQTAENRGDG
ncbi:hypothetical protein CesoFtcFv8_022580 [Champsocephalus esox]|uniref:Methyltransferase domain-containing protein n=1 Tax=Champsocephalus esox TaxID=159716 RepID=A0AAN8B763_9TELE|nr:hypothetical protein CesoFtcFv8_022580 [Champsocephalus esox]